MWRWIKDASGDCGFMLWEVLAACSVFAVMLQVLMDVSLASFEANRVRIRQQTAQQWALSMLDQLAAGYTLKGRVPLSDELLPQGVACLRERHPWHLISLRWQIESERSLPECFGPWPSAQQLCLDEEACE